MATTGVVAATADAATTPARPAHVVRRPAGEIVLILFGRDSRSEASSWRSRGYQVEAVNGEDVGL